MCRSHSSKQQILGVPDLQEFGASENGNHAGTAQAKLDIVSQEPSGGIHRVLGISMVSQFVLCPPLPALDFLQFALQKP